MRRPVLAAVLGVRADPPAGGLGPASRADAKARYSFARRCAAAVLGVRLPGAALPAGPTPQGTAASPRPVTTGRGWFRRALRQPGYGVTPWDGVLVAPGPSGPPLAVGRVPVRRRWRARLAAAFGAFLAALAAVLVPLLMSSQPGGAGHPNPGDPYTLRREPGSFSLLLPRTAGPGFGPPSRRAYDTGHGDLTVASYRGATRSPYQQVRQERAAAVRLPGYFQIADARWVGAGAAELEYRVTSGGGTRHVLVRAFTVPGGGLYSLTASGPEAEWAALSADLHVAESSFCPAGRPCGAQ